MDIFVALVQDRHTDVDAAVFSKDDAAIAWARKMAGEFSSGPVNETLTEDMKAAGWLYYGSYSCEGDPVRVIRRKQDAK
jgi:hypothetical protein